MPSLAYLRYEKCEDTTAPLEACCISKETYHMSKETYKIDILTLAYLGAGSLELADTIRVSV
jgi:hypothetical protein